MVATPPVPEGSPPDASGRPPKAGDRTVAFIFTTILINAIGIGIVLPVMPELIRDLTDLTVSGAAFWGGLLTMSYAAMQFLCSPTIGNLSDRYGRRPVLVLSLVTLSADYLVMAMADSLWMLFVGRMVGGAAAATLATANAMMADITPPAKRAQNFGLIGAAFGAGFIAGPLIGGLAGELGPRVPFLVASAICTVNLVFGWAMVPESLPRARRRAFS